MRAVAPGAKLRLAALIFLALTLVLSGAAGGWWLNDRTRGTDDRTQVAVAINRPYVAIGHDDKIAEIVPNVIGLSADQATAVFLDAGYPAETILQSLTPAGGPPNLVVGQTPRPRAASTGRVVLHVSQTTTTPDLVGLSLDDAKERLRDLGARAVVARDYDPNVPEGQVLSTSPAQGMTLPQEVELVVSEAPSAVFLRSLRATESDNCRAREVTIEDNTFDESYNCDASSEEAFITFTVNPGIARLRAELAQSIHNSDNVPITAIVSADGENVHEVRIDKGNPIELDANVLGATSVTIQFIQQSSGSVTAQVLVANPTLIGSREAVDAVVASTGR